MLSPTPTCLTLTFSLASGCHPARHCGNRQQAAPTSISWTWHSLLPQGPLHLHRTLTSLSTVSLPWFLVSPCPVYSSGSFIGSWRLLLLCWWCSWVPAPALLLSLHQPLWMIKKNLRASACLLVHAHEMPGSVSSSYCAVCTPLHAPQLLCSFSETWKAVNIAIRSNCRGSAVVTHTSEMLCLSYFQVLDHVLATAEPAGKSDCKEDGTNSHERWVVENQKYLE